MANIELLIPHILTWEIGLTAQERMLGTARAMYDSVAKRGYHNKATDLGGPTMVGVTLNTYTEYCRKKGRPAPTVDSLKKLGFEDWKAIMKEMFWNPINADQINNQSIAELLVDWRWVNGGAAVRAAQRILGLNGDGIVGPKTLRALNTGNLKETFEKLQEARRQSYHKIVAARPSQKVNLQGWLNRTNSFTFKPW